MSDIVRFETTDRSSRVVVYNGVVYVGGMTPNEDSGDIKEQTRQTLERIDKYLALAGTDKSRLLTAQIWLKDIVNDFKGMNEVWNAWTALGAAPTRATAQCDMADPDLRVEIIVTAAVGQQR
jgi:enamine deaminase RidA (YjgF/YER057c/UK114 family)